MDSWNTDDIEARLNAIEHHKEIVDPELGVKFVANIMLRIDRVAHHNLKLRAPDWTV